MNPNKFCHGFGIFQYDIQFFPKNPRFFLDRQWTSLDACLALCVAELKAALKRAYGSRKATLTYTGAAASPPPRRYTKQRDVQKRQPR